MTEISIDEILAGKQNKFPLVIAVSKLAREIEAKADEVGEILVEKPVVTAFRNIKDHEYKMFYPDEINDQNRN